MPGPFAAAALKFGPPIVGGLLGGLGGKGAAKAANRPRNEYTNQTQTSSPFAPALPFLQFGLDQSLFNFMRPATPFPTLPPIVAGGGLGSNARELIDRLSLGGSEFLSLGKDFIKNLLEGDVGDNPFVQRNIDDFQRESMETFRESQVPFTNSRFALGGQVASGLRNAALARVNEEFNESVQAGINQLLSQAFSENLRAQVAASGTLPAFHSASMQGPIAALNALVQESAIRAPLQLQAQLANRDFALQDFFYNENLPQQRLSDFLAGILPIAGLGGTTTLRGRNVVPGAGVNTGLAGLSGALGGALRGGMFGGKGGGPTFVGSPTGGQIGIPNYGLYPFSLF